MATAWKAIGAIWGRKNKISRSSSVGGGRLQIGSPESSASSVLDEARLLELQMVVQLNTAQQRNEFATYRRGQDQ
jgi:hypothetical protein